jgi:hypothetical protein
MNINDAGANARQFLEDICTVAGREENTVCARNRLAEHVAQRSPAIGAMSRRKLKPPAAALDLIGSWAG